MLANTNKPSKQGGGMYDRVCPESLLCSQLQGKQYLPWMRSVASPPSSTSSCGPSPLGQVRHCSVHHQYSSSVSPFQAKTAAESRAIAAAAWSCKEVNVSNRAHSLSQTRSSAKIAGQPERLRFCCRGKQAFKSEVVRGRRLPRR